jgi:hypothetical protein
MSTLPKLVKGNINHSHHVVILGAGASKAAFPTGDSYEHKLPLMNDLVTTLGLREILEEHGFSSEIVDFEQFFDSLVSSGKYSDLVQRLEKEIRSYFEVLQIPDCVTLYDYLLLSLREKDIIASFNWDPLLVQAYARNSHISRLPRICFLHGNVAVGSCVDDRKVGYLHEVCNACNKPMGAVPLIYPIKDKNYTDNPYIRSEWSVLQRHIEDAYFITVFGYSAPQTDVKARELMLKVWQKNQILDFSQFEVVDIKSPSELAISWKDFVVRNNFGTTNNFFDTYLARHPRRSCDSFAMAQLQQMPWRDNSFPEFEYLADLQAWVQPLLEEEKKEYFSGNPCPPVG